MNNPPPNIEIVSVDQREQALCSLDFAELIEFEINNSYAVLAEIEVILDAIFTQEVDRGLGMKLTACGEAFMPINDLRSSHPP